MQVLHDWQWSVGQTPHSLTSQAPVLSQLQIDAVWRIYVVDALDVSAQRVTTAIRCVSPAIAAVPSNAKPLPCPITVLHCSCTRPVAAQAHPWRCVLPGGLLSAKPNIMP